MMRQTATGHRGNDRRDHALLVEEYYCRNYFRPARAERARPSVTPTTVARHVCRGLAGTANQVLTTGQPIVMRTGPDPLSWNGCARQVP